MPLNRSLSFLRVVERWFSLLSKQEVTDAETRCRHHRRRILETSQLLSALHVAPAFSCLEIVDAIYFYSLNATSDTFILSKGHGAMAQYAVLEAMGIMSQEQLNSVCQPGSQIGGHPDRGNPGVIASTGSLGHGLPIAVGLARADNERESDGTIFVVMSDGEFMEGSTWEALLLAPSIGVTNIVVVVDHNKSISRGEIPVAHPNMLPLAPKISAFGWSVAEADGHSVNEITTAISQRPGGQPFALVCHTTKGRGVSFMENEPIWAYRSPSDDEFVQAMDELADPPGDEE